MQFALTPGAPTVPGMMADIAASHDAPPAGYATQTQASAQASRQAAGGVGTAEGVSAEAVPVAGGAEQVVAAATPQDAGNIPLPDVVAYVPTPKPDNPFATVMPALDAGPSAVNGALPVVALIPQPNPVASGQIPVPVSIPAAGAATLPQAAAYAGATPAPAPHKPRGFFATLFAPSSGNNIAARASAHQLPRVEQSQIVALLDEGKTKPLIDANASAKPIVDLVSDDEAPATQYYGAESPLPGVRSDNSLFEITRKSSIGDNSDVDINEEGAAPVEMASAAGMARLDPNGLVLQRDTVDTACLRPALLAVLKKIEQHYGKRLVVTSGFRSRVHNAAARGAHNSLHMYCAAADIQMPGVSKWELAAYARSMPGRGGIGTYCYTKSVHIDIGPERDWNWRCRRKRHRR